MWALELEEFDIPEIFASCRNAYEVSLFITALDRHMYQGSRSPPDNCLKRVQGHFISLQNGVSTLIAGTQVKVLN